MLKKIFYVTFIVVAILVAVAIYMVFFKKPSAQNSNSNVTVDNSLPFGPQGLNRDPQNSNNDVSTNPDNGVTVTDLMHITVDPVSGGTIRESKTVASVRYTERATSHVFDVDLATGAITRVSNTTIPKTAESYWLNNGTSTIVRYVSENETIKSLLLNLVKTGTSSDTVAPYELKGKNLSDNIDNLAISPSKTQYFYLVRNSAGVNGTIVNAKGAETRIFTSTASEWLAGWPAEGTIALTTKAAAGVRGSLYFLSAKGGLTRVIGDILGLTTVVNRSLSKVAYSNDQGKLSIYSLTDGSTKTVDVSTLSEKCVWSSKKTNILYCAVPTLFHAVAYPTSWYQGSVSFTDDIYKINADTGRSELLVGLTSVYKNDIDVINPMLSDSENYLLFTNKLDGTLWSFKLASSTATTTR